MRKINGVPVEAHTDLSSLTGGEVLKWDADSGKMVWQDQDSSNLVPVYWYGDRGLFAGGLSGTAYTYINEIDYINITALGNANDFGDLLVSRSTPGACSDGARAVFAGGYLGAYKNDMDYVTISTTGNATDFGDVARPTKDIGACSDGTTGLFAGGSYTGQASSNIIEYITIQTAGGTTDFGDLTVGRNGVRAGSTGSRAVFAGSSSSASINDTTIDYVTFATAGNATDFGDLQHARRSTGGGSHNNVRLFSAGGYGHPEYANVDTIEYITMATTGNAADFGNLTRAWSGCIGTANGTRALFAGGSILGDSWTEVIDYITIDTTGNAADFGDLNKDRGSHGATSGNA